MWTQAFCASSSLSLNLFRTGIAHQRLDSRGLIFATANNQPEFIRAETRPIARFGFERREVAVKKEPADASETAKQDHQLEHDDDVRRNRGDWFAAGVEVPFPGRADRQCDCAEK